MRIIRFADLKQVPWKNGGGITREVAAERDAENIIWRLSMADVASDSAFSKFEGLRRILTVTQGQGMELITAEAVLQADFSVPVVFDGDLEIQSRLKDGPLRDFNVIYDPKRCHVEAEVWRGKCEKTLAATDTIFWALHCIAGEMVLNDRDALKQGDTVFLDSGILSMTLTGEGICLAISVQKPALFQTHV